MVDTIAIFTTSGTIISELLESDEDEEGIEDLECAVIALTSVAREDRIKSQVYYELTVPNYLPDEFKRFFRVNPGTFEQICAKLAEYPELRNAPISGGRTQIPLEKKVLITLRYLASGAPIHSLSDTFNVTDFSLLRCRAKVIKCINTHMLPKFIQWPAANDLLPIANTFDQMGAYNFPNIIGAVDGCHIPIEAPHENPNSYFNRKKFHSVILQGTCTDNLRFIHINVGWPGRVHDAKVMRNSSLWETGFAKCLNGRFHLLGDAAYPLKEWLLAPYRDNGHLTRQQRRFNTALSSKRQVIERTFGLLKGRFRRLKYIHARSMETICQTITAACVLHNICIVEGDEVDDIIPADREEDNDAQPPVVNENDARGALKRLNITNAM